MGIGDVGEFGLIGMISGQFKAPEGVTGIGDDCAVIPQRDGSDTLVSTDMLIEGTHFILDDIGPRDLGWKSAAVNLSDIAAMGGRPTGTFLSMALPKGTSTEWVSGFIEGYRDISDRFGVPLLGGDTTASPDRVCVNVTVIGECPHGQARTRSGAMAGDLVCVTGTLGDSAAGLRLILDGRRGIPCAGYLMDRHHAPLPRIDEGIALAASDGVHAMMDISDGIGSDIRHILSASGCGAAVDLSLIPMSDQLRECCGITGWDAAEIAVTGGEDYELLFTVSPRQEPFLTVAHTVIGKITSEPGLVWKGSDRDLCGFRHF